MSVYRWMLGGAIVGLLGPIVNGIPYDNVVAITSYLLGGAFGGALIAGIAASLINHIRGR